MVILKYCNIIESVSGCITTFPDETSIESFPHDIPHYYVIAHRCGYGDNLLWYCREHDFFHAFCEEYFHDRPSPVLWSLAHGEEVISTYEEIVVQTCQRWVRSNERPIIGGVDWDAFRARAVELLEIYHG
jgi:hypothetical protein